MSARTMIAMALLAGSCTEPPPLRATTAPSDEEPPPQVSASAATSADTEAFDPKKVSLEQKAMGTKVTIVAYTSATQDETKVGVALTKAFREITRLEKLMSTWIDTSEVSRINAVAGKAAVVVGPDTLAVVEKSQWIAEQSGGLFDITFDVMHGLWKFDDGAEDRIPDKKILEKTRKLIDYRQIEIDHDKSTIKLKKDTSRINLGGIAKGYAVDVASRSLDEDGIKSYFVQAGGDLFVRGRRPGNQAFRVGVRNPRGGPDDSFAMMTVEDHAFSTAGDYERYFIHDKKRYHHIIDPRTGYPATASRSVTIWAKDAFTADAIDDAVFILGPEKGLELVESIDGAGAVIVDKDNKVWISKRLENVLHVDHQPTDGI